MQKLLSLLTLSLLVLSACNGPPPPEGPAAEATTPDVEVTMPDISTSGTEPVAEPKSMLVSFSVPGMTAQENISEVRSTLSEQPGVAMVDVDFETKTATCSVDPSKFDAKIALEKLTNHDQFKGSTLIERR